MQCTAQARFACTPAVRARRQARLSAVTVRAFFNTNSNEAERRKEEQWRVQQERLEERRAKREQIMRKMGRGGADEDASSAAAPSKPSKKATKAQVVIMEEPQAKGKAGGGNPLSGLMNMFGRK